MVRCTILSRYYLFITITLSGYYSTIGALGQNVSEGFHMGAGPPGDEPYGAQRRDDGNDHVLLLRLPADSISSHMFQEQPLHQSASQQSNYVQQQQHQPRMIPQPQQQQASEPQEQMISLTIPISELRSVPASLQDEQAERQHQVAQAREQQRAQETIQKALIEYLSSAAAASARGESTALFGAQPQQQQPAASQAGQTFYLQPQPTITSSQQMIAPQLPQQQQTLEVNLAPASSNQFVTVGQLIPAADLPAALSQQHQVAAEPPRLWKDTAGNQFMATTYNSSMAPTNQTGSSAQQQQAHLADLLTKLAGSSPDLLLRLRAMLRKATQRQKHSSSMQANVAGDSLNYTMAASLQEAQPSSQFNGILSSPSLSSPSYLPAYNLTTPNKGAASIINEPQSIDLADNLLAARTKQQQPPSQSEPTSAISNNAPASLHNNRYVRLRTSLASSFPILASQNLTSTHEEIKIPLVVIAMPRLSSMKKSRAAAWRGAQNSSSLLPLTIRDLLANHFGASSSNNQTTDKSAATPSGNLMNGSNMLLASSNGTHLIQFDLDGGQANGSSSSQPTNNSNLTFTHQNSTDNYGPLFYLASGIDGGATRDHLVSAPQSAGQKQNQIRYQLVESTTSNSLHTMAPYAQQFAVPLATSPLVGRQYHAYGQQDVQANEYQILEALNGTSQPGTLPDRIVQTTTRLLHPIIDGILRGRLSNLTQLPEPLQQQQQPQPAVYSSPVMENFQIQVEPPSGNPPQQILVHPKATYQRQPTYEIQSEEEEVEEQEDEHQRSRQRAQSSPQQQNHQSRRPQQQQPTFQDEPIQQQPIQERNFQEAARHERQQVIYLNPRAQVYSSDSEKANEASSRAHLARLASSHSVVNLAPTSHQDSMMPPFHGQPAGNYRAKRPIENLARLRPLFQVARRRDQFEAVPARGSQTEVPETVLADQMLAMFAASNSDRNRRQVSKKSPKSQMMFMVM